jgi:hypothetical protein
MILPKGSPVLFNEHLEEALKSSSRLKAVRERRDLLVFTDEILAMTTNNQNELVMIIHKFVTLKQQSNLIKQIF